MAKIIGSLAMVRTSPAPNWFAWETPMNTSAPRSTWWRVPVSPLGFCDGSQLLFAGSLLSVLITPLRSQITIPLAPAARRSFSDGVAGCSCTVDHDLKVTNFLVHDPQSRDESRQGNHCGAVLVVVENWNVQLFI